MKSHFVFTKEQRSGILWLLLIIVILQCVYFFITFSSEDDITVKKEDLLRYYHKIDSLKKVAIKNNKPTVYPFNPNYITDFKGYTLGMSNKEIDKLHRFRKANQWINSAEQFKLVTGVSDSLLAILSPKFKFPEWVTATKPKIKNANYSTKSKLNVNKKDLNTATALDLQRVNGIGNKLSERIVDYRNTLKGGFASDVELQEIYGLNKEVIAKVRELFTVKTPRVLNVLNLNVATADELVKIKHIDYEIAYNIIEYRKLHEGFKSVTELRKVKDFPISKLEIIQLSLYTK